MKESSEKKEKLLVRSSLRVRKELSLWLNYNLVMIFGGIIGIRSTEIKVEAAERTVRFWDNSGRLR